MSPVDPIRVVIADDHPVVRAGLPTILHAAPDIRVVSEAGDGERAVAEVAEHRPDVTLLDVRMPTLDGLAALARIRHSDPHAREILFSAHDDEEEVARAGGRGERLPAKGCSSGRVCVVAVRLVRDGRTVLGPRAAERLAGRLSARALSDREREVLALVAEGHGNKQIARELGIADGTVKVHVANILEKLGVQGRALAEAARRGLVRLA